MTIKGAEGHNVTNFEQLFVVILDEVYNSAKAVSETHIVKNIDVKDEENRKVIPAGAEGSELEQFPKGFYSLLTKIGLMMFISLFLGLVFILICL
ncbi:hypothetical protein [Bacillus mycoides]|uniref:hypothetical protein n=1 Tax=Bacillus mycoides TaxID=1405 RepID=UPI0011A0D0D4|nr:hypothetical protein [Bacillus mycoides]